MIKGQKDKPFNLLQWFSLLSCLSITLITLVSASLLSRFLSHNMLQRDAIVTMEFVQTIAQSLNAGTYFEERDTGNTRGAFEDFFKKIATMPEVVRANVYRQGGGVIWSDDKRLIGKNFMPNQDLILALDGKLAVSSGKSGKPLKAEHVFDQSVPFFAEIYIPIWNSTKTKVVGAVEVYKVPLNLSEAIARGNRLVWISAILGGLFLYASLFWIVRRAAAIIQKQQEQLVASETMAAIGEMTSVVAHGIRNPLASIRSTAELALEEQTLSQEPSEEIIAEADRLEAWVRELLAYSRPASDKWVPLEINRVMESVIEGFERELEKHGIQYSLKIEKPTPIIQAEESFLRHVIANIFSNAIEAMPGGGLLSISISADAKREHIEIVIEDTGVGISSEQMKNMFKPFFTTKAKGLGVGLSLAKRIIERHGGTIQVASKKNKGTKVSLNIPISR